MSACNIKPCLHEVSQGTFACPEHWALIPADLRRKIWRHYGNGEETGKTASAELTSTALDAQEAVEKKFFEICVQSHKAGCGCWQLARVNS